MESLLSKKVFQLGHEILSKQEMAAAAAGGFILLLLIINVFWKSNKGKKPPGPIGLPVVGYLPFLTNTPHLKLAKLASKYGEIFSLRLGGKFAIVLNDAEIIKKAFSKQEFLGRPENHTYSIVPGFESPFASNGKAWKEQRKFIMQLLKDLGLGKQKMEQRVKEEIGSMIKEMKKNGRKNIEVRDLLTPSISNIICVSLFGSRYEYNHPWRESLDRIVESFSAILRQTSGRFFMPWLYKLPFSRKLFVDHDLAEDIAKFKSFVSSEVEEHKKSLDPSNMRDYIDGYLIELKKRLETDPRTTFSENMLIGSMVNLFGAGSETVRITVDWCLYTMAVYPEVQRKVQEEIDTIIGRDRLPAYSDSKKMPYTKSVLMEVQRWQTIVPVNILRCTTDDCELEGYHIPKNTIVLSNLWTCHHSEKYWKDPMEFQPDRFLSDDGKNLKTSEYYMPFSYGKRSCPGEVLAVTEVFHYFTSILQQFTVNLPEGDEVNFQGDLSVTYQLKPHKLAFHSRY